MLEPIDLLNFGVWKGNKGFQQIQSINYSFTVHRKPLIHKYTNNLQKVNMENKVGKFGEQFTQFKNKPKEAIQFLRIIQRGECIGALYRKEIGYVDIIWGDSKKGLCHIIKKHEKELQQINISVEDLIVTIFQVGKIERLEKESKITISNDKFLMVVKTKYDDEAKTWLLSSYDLRPIQTKKASKKDA